MRCCGLRENLSYEPHSECDVYGFYLKVMIFIKKTTTNKTSISLLHFIFLKSEDCMNTPVPFGKQLHFCGCEEYGSFSPCAAHS